MDQIIQILNASQSLKGEARRSFLTYLRALINVQNVNKRRHDETKQY